jgi:predicted transposase
MILTVQIRLLPREWQGRLREKTMRRWNEAANEASLVAWKTGTYSRSGLQKLVYRDLRANHRISAQAAIRMIARVCDSYANPLSNKANAHVFRPLGAAPYDARLLSFDLEDP